MSLSNSWKIGQDIEKYPALFVSCQFRPSSHTLLCMLVLPLCPAGGRSSPLVCAGNDPLLSVVPTNYIIASMIPNVNTFLKKNRYFFKFFLIFFRAGTLTGWGFVAVEKRRQENTFFAEGESAMAGMSPPIFSDRHQDQKKKKKKRKEKNQKKRKDLLFIYICFKKIKE